MRCCRRKETKDESTQTLVTEIVGAESSSSDSPTAPEERGDHSIYPDITPSGSEDTLEYLERFVKSPEKTVVRKGPRSPWLRQDQEQ